MALGVGLIGIWGEEGKVEGDGRKEGGKQHFAGRQCVERLDCRVIEGM